MSKLNTFANIMAWGSSSRAADTAEKNNKELKKQTEYLRQMTLTPEKREKERLEKERKAFSKSIAFAALLAIGFVMTYPLIGIPLLIIVIFVFIKSLKAKKHVYSKDTKVTRITAANPINYDKQSVKKSNRDKAPAKTNHTIKSTTSTHDKLDKLLELYLEGAISKTVYNKKVSAIKNQEEAKRIPQQK